jgi:hypothetical protein
MRPDLHFKERMAPEESMIVLGGHQMEVVVFEYGNRPPTDHFEVLVDQRKGILPTIPHRIDTIAGAAGKWHFGKVEFPLEIADLPAGAPGMTYGRIDVKGFLSVAGRELPILLVFTEFMDDQVLSYEAVPIAHGWFSTTFHVPASSAGVRNKLYIWDREGGGLEMEDLRIQVYYHREG